MQPTSAEAHRVRLLSQEYREKGYNVIESPTSDQMPSFLRPFHPDLIARRGEGGIVVEVTTRSSLARTPEVQEMARLLQDQPGWTFELVLVGAGDQALLAEGAQAFDEEDVARGLGEAKRLLDAGFAEAALLYAWAATEAALRLLAQREHIELDRPTPLHLLKKLAVEGVLPRSDYAQLMGAARLRNALAHGYRAPSFEPITVEHLISMAKKLIRPELSTS